MKSSKNIEQENEIDYSKALDNLRSYLFGNSTLNKDALLKNLTIFAQQQMEKDYDVNLLDTKFRTDNINAFGVTNGNKVTLRSDIFTDKQKLMKNINTVFHELRHVAQFESKPKDGIDLEFCEYEFFDDIIPSFNLSLGDEKSSPLFVKKYKGYLTGLYAKNEWEIDARGFALDLTHSLLEQCSTNLPKEMQEVYEDYRQQLQQLIDKEEFDILYSQANELYSSKDFIKDTKYIIKTIIGRKPINLYMSEAFSENPNNELLKKNYFIIDGLIECLAFSYNDKLARKTADLILGSNADDNIKLHFMTRLFVKTDFALTDDDLKTLNKLYDDDFPIENYTKYKQHYKKIVDNTFKVNAKGQDTQD